MPSEARQKKIMEKLNRAQKCSILGPQNLGSAPAATHQHPWVQLKIPAFKTLEHISSTTQRSLSVTLERVALLTEIQLLCTFYHAYLLRLTTLLTSEEHFRGASKQKHVRATKRTSFAFFNSAFVY